MGAGDGKWHCFPQAVGQGLRVLSSEHRPDCSDFSSWIWRRRKGAERPAARAPARAARSIAGSRALLCHLFWRSGAARPKQRTLVPWGVTGLNPELLGRKIKHAGDFSREKFKFQLDSEPCRSSPRWLCS